jgi:hypothetical protein
MSSRFYFLSLLVLFLTACVSKSSYTALQQDHSRVQNDSLLLEKRIRQLQDENQRLSTESAKKEQALNNRLQEKQDSLSYKEQLLRERELSLKDMKARKEEESEAFATLAKTIFSGFQDYEQQTLIKQVGCASMTISVNDKKLFSGNGTKTELLSQELHAKMITLLEKYPDISLTITAYSDSAFTVKDKSASDPFAMPYTRASVLYKELTTGLSKSVKQRISIAIKNEVASRNWPQQTDYIFLSSLIPCIHTKK